MLLEKQDISYRILKAIAPCFICLVTSFLLLENGVLKYQKKTGPLYPLITCESFINFLFGDTQIPGDTKAGR